MMYFFKIGLVVMLGYPYMAAPLFDKLREAFDKKLLHGDLPGVHNSLRVALESAQHNNNLWQQVLSGGSDGKLVTRSNVMRC